jgi:hypothetical protein
VRSRKEFSALRPLRLRVFALILSLMMPLLTELDSFSLSFLQICQSYGLCHFQRTKKRPPFSVFVFYFDATGRRPLCAVAAVCDRTESSLTERRYNVTDAVARAS